MSIDPVSRTHSLTLGKFILAAILVSGAAGAMANTAAIAFGVVGQNAPYNGSDRVPLNVVDYKGAPGATQSQAAADRTTSGPSGAASSHASAFAEPGRLAVAALSSTSVKVGGIDSQGNPYERLEAPSAQSEATARWGDQVTINASGLTGTRGSLNATLRLNGSATASADPYIRLQSPDGGLIFMDFDSSASVSIVGSGISSITQPWDDACAAVGMAGRIVCARSMGSDPGRNYARGNVQDLPVTLDFAFGSPFSLSYSIVADSSAQSTISAYKFLATGEARGSADMSHTLLWGGIDGVFGANGAAVAADYSVTALSGFDYRNAAPVPEPSTYALLLVGLGAIGLLRLANARSPSTVLGHRASTNL